MEYFAYLTALLMGVLLGLIGGGGSILTLPALVYLLKIPSTEATTYSLFIVGLSAFLGASYYIKHKFIDWKTMLVFGFPSLLATLFTRSKIIPALPQIIHLFGLDITKDFLILILFSMFMLCASFSMLRPKKVIQQGGNSEIKRYRYFLILIGGLAIGTIVGLLGAGGGFLIIPTLVILANLPMKKAIGTSLGLIFINCSIGFSCDIYHGIRTDWHLLLIFTSFAILGMTIGLYLSRYISGSKLKPAFGWFILVVGFCILVKEYCIYHNT